MVNNTKITVTKIIKDLEMSLSDKGFLRVHKSYLINMAHVAAHKKEDSGYLLMSNNMEVPIGAKDKDDILYTLRKYANIIY